MAGDPTVEDTIFVEGSDGVTGDITAEFVPTAINVTIKGIISGFTLTKWTLSSADSWSLPYSAYSIDTDSQNMNYTDDLSTSSWEEFLSTWEGGSISLVITLEDGNQLTVLKGDYLVVDNSTPVFTATFDAISYINDNPNCGLTYEGQTITDSNTEDNSSNDSTTEDTKYIIKIQGPVNFQTLTIDDRVLDYKDFVNNNNILTYSAIIPVATCNIKVTTDTGTYTVDSKYIAGWSNTSTDDTNDYSVLDEYKDGELHYVYAGLNKCTYTFIYNTDTQLWTVVTKSDSSEAIYTDEQFLPVFNTFPSNYIDNDEPKAVTRDPVTNPSVSVTAKTGEDTTTKQVIAEP